MAARAHWSFSDFLRHFEKDYGHNEMDEQDLDEESSDETAESTAADEIDIYNHDVNPPPSNSAVTEFVTPDATASVSHDVLEVKEEDLFLDYPAKEILSAEDFIGQNTLADIGLSEDSTRSLACTVCCPDSNSSQDDNYEDIEDETVQSNDDMVFWKRCHHPVCKECLLDLLPKVVSVWTSIECFECDQVYGFQNVGDQPSTGKMEVKFNKSANLKGHPGVGTYEMQFNFESDPNANTPYLAKNFPMKAFLPGDNHGRALVKMIHEAFQRRLLFTIIMPMSRRALKKSTKRGTLIVNPGITLKHGARGFPDRGYLDRLDQQLNKLGIANPWAANLEAEKNIADGRAFLTTKDDEKQESDHASESSSENDSDDEDAKQPKACAIPTKKNFDKENNNNDIHVQAEDPSANFGFTEVVRKKANRRDQDNDEAGPPYVLDHERWRIKFKPHTNIPVKFHDILTMKAKTMTKGVVAALFIEKGFGFIRPVGGCGRREDNIFFLVETVKNITDHVEILVRGTRVQYFIDSRVDRPKAFMVFIGEGTLEDAIQASIARSDDCSPGWDGRGTVIGIDNDSGGYKLHNNYLVPFDKVPVYSLSIVPGDKMEYKRLRVGSWRDIFQARVVTYSKRPKEVLRQYYEDFGNLIEYHEEQSDRALSEVLTNGAMWHLFGKVHEQADAYYLAWLLSFVTKILKKARNQTPLVMHVLPNFLASAILQEANAIFFKSRVEEPAAQAALRETIKNFCFWAIQMDRSQGPRLFRLAVSVIDSFEDKVFIHSMFRLLLDPSAPSINLAGEEEQVGGGQQLSIREGLRHTFRIMPEPSEVVGVGFENDPTLKEILLGSRHASSEDYLDQYYHLMKAETFSPVQKTIRLFTTGCLKPDDYNNRCVYKNVTLVGVNTFGRSITLSLKIKPHKRKVNWEKSSQLLPGNLLALSMSHDFTDTIWLAVENKDLDLLTMDSVILAKVCEGNAYSTAEIIAMLIKFGRECVMIESPTFSMAYFPVLKSIRDMDLSCYALEDLIVTQDKKANYMPEYLTRALDESNPNQERVRQVVGGILRQLDSSQQTAFRSAINSRLAIIQGPPGTGKTHIGIKLATLILEADLDGPIMVLTYKNHALDEFLKHMVRVCGLENIVRIGGRCQEEILKPRNLKEIMKARRKPMGAHQRYNDQIWERTKEIRRLSERVAYLAKELNHLSSFNARDFLGALNEPQLASLLMDNWDAISFTKARTKSTVDFSSKNEVRHAMDLLKVHFGNLTGYVQAYILGNNNNDDKCLKIPDGVKRYAAKLESYLIHATASWIPKKDKLKIVEDLYEALTSHDYDSAILHDPNDAMDTIENQRKEDEREASKTGSGEGECPGGGGEDDMMDIDDDVVAELNALQANAIFDNAGDIDHGGVTGRGGRYVKGQQRKSLREQVTYWKKPTDGVSKKAQQFSFQSSEFPSFIELLPDTVMANQTNLWQMPTAFKYRFIYSMLVRMTKPLEEEFNKLVEELEQLQKEKEALEMEDKVDVARDAKILGITITGASIQKQMVQRIAPKVVIVEEAAEVLEPSLLAAISASTEHLILIGDHKQLRPQVETYDLVRKFNFDISMMERLIENGYPYATLAKQNRMRPEISHHLKDIYPILEDNLAIVGQHQKPKCLDECLFWWSHDSPEDKPQLNADTGVMDRTKSNTEEAHMAISLALYLIRSKECRPCEITILAAYLGQKKLIRNLLTDFYRNLYGHLLPKNNGIQCQTIDTYQGDENKYIIVSMVRSSTLGYMAMLNRRCVAQSRAKCGLYYVGNLKLFGPASVKKNILADDEDDDNDESQRSNVWTGMVKNMLDEGRVGNTIIAHCPKHPDSSRHEIRAPGDFFSLIKKDAGMCDTPCGKDMPCGEHKCHRPCSSRFHNHVTCRTIVQDICLAGEHDIERKCYENRGDILCHVKVPFTFNCGQGHTGHKKCYMDPGDKSLRCKRRCGLPMDCGIEGHTCRNKCGDAHDHSYCSAKVKASVPSCDSVPKHMIDKECSGIIDESFPCTKKIRTILDREHCQHTVEKLCSQADIDVDCPEICGKINDCGLHSCKKACGKKEHRHDDCDDMVEFDYPCGHPAEVQKKCSEPITGLCVMPSQVYLPKCGHVQASKCYQKVEDVKCHNPCQKTRSCGHPCQDMECWEDCDSGTCNGCLLREAERLKKVRNQTKIKIGDLTRKIHNADDEKTVVDISTLDKTGALFCQVRDKVIQYIQPGSYFYREVIKIERIQNLNLELAFMQAKVKSLNDYTVELLYGIEASGSSGIPKKGFRMPSEDADNQFGRGLYFADNNSYEVRELYSRGPNKMFLCNVLVGRYDILTKDNPDLCDDLLRKRGFDSVFAKNSNEFVIYDPRRALPTFIIHLAADEINVVDRIVKEQEKSITGVDRRRFKTNAKMCHVNDVFDIQLRIVESHFWEALNDLPSKSKWNSVTLDSVDFVYNRKLADRFNGTLAAFKAAGINPNEVLGYYAVDDRAKVEAILKINLNDRQNLAGGPGFYFHARPDLSEDHVSSMILFRLLPGREYTGQDLDKHLLLPRDDNDNDEASVREFDSKIVDGDVIIIDNPDQFVPFGVLNFHKN